MSCPHYLGEIVLYLGLAILIGDQSLDVWLVLAWVVRFRSRAAGCARVMTPHLHEDGSLGAEAYRGF